MCKDVEHELTEAAKPLQTIERLPLTGKVGQTSCLEQQDCNQTITEQKPVAVPECSESEPKEPEELNSEASGLLGQSPHPDQSEASIQHENTDETKEPNESEEIVCTEVEEPEVVDQQEQTETLTEQSLQTADTCRPIVCEQPGQTHDTTESENTDGVTHQIEADMAKPSHRTDGVGDVKTVVANGEQAKPLYTAVPHMNGGDVDREAARLLAERLFTLDDIQRVDVVKHLDKE